MIIPTEFGHSFRRQKTRQTSRCDRISFWIMTIEYKLDLFGCELSSHRCNARRSESLDRKKVLSKVHSVIIKCKFTPLLLHAMCLFVPQLCMLHQSIVWPVATTSKLSKIFVVLKNMAIESIGNRKKKLASMCKFASKLNIRDSSAAVLKCFAALIYCFMYK